MIITTSSAPALGRVRTGGIARNDPVDDFLLDCSPTAAPGPGLAAMDLTRAHALGVRDGAEVFDLETAGDASAYFSSEPPSASFVIALVTRPGGPRYNLIREIHQGQRRSVVERDGVSFPDATLLVAKRDSGTPRFTVTGIPDLNASSRWGVTTFVLPEVHGARLCDRLGFDTKGNPTLLLRPTPSAPPHFRPDDRGLEDDDRDWIWWLIGVFGFVAVLLLAWLFVAKGWRPRWPTEGRSHGAPDTPPPEQNDFGE
jgi:hypothetical protein